MPGGRIGEHNDSFRLPPSFKTILQPILVASSFLLLSIALEKCIPPSEASGVKQIYLPAGLNLALLLSCGLQYAPVLVLSNLIVGLWLHPVPAGPFGLIILSTTISLIYMLGAGLVRLLLARSEARLQGRKGFTQVLQGGLAVAIAAAVTQSIGLALAGVISWSRLPVVFLGGVAGIILGVLSITPFWVFYAVPALEIVSQKLGTEKNFYAKLSLAARLSKTFALETLALFVGTLLLTLFVFRLPVLDHFALFALFSLPLVAMAIVRGLQGVTAGILVASSAVILTFWIFPVTELRVAELQALLLAASVNGLLVGSAVTEKKFTQKALKRRESVLESIGFAATHILGNADWDKRANQVLRNLGEATEVTRVYIFENRARPGELGFESPVFEWCTGGLVFDPHHYKVLNVLRSHQLEANAKNLAEGHAVHFQTENLADKERAILSTLGIRSTVVVPIFAEGQWWGCLGLDRDLSQPDWTIPEIAGLRAAARVLGTLLARARMETQFRQLTGNIRAVFWVSTPDGLQRIYVSPAYEQIWGRTCASLYRDPTSWMSSIHAADFARVQAALATQMWGEYVEEYRIILPDRSVRWIRDRGFPVKDEHGQVCQIVGLAEDISVQKQVEEQLKSTTLLLSTLVDHLQSGILVEDEERRVIHVSQLFCSMFEIPTPRQALLGVDSRLLFLKPKVFAQQIEEQIRGGCAVMGEELTLEDGRILKRDYVPLQTSAGGRYHLWQYTDITDSKRTESQIKASLTEKEVLLKEIHHRVKNNLQIISSLLSLQARQMGNGKPLQMFQDSQNRLKAMALIHERLYQSPDLSQIDFAHYARGLAEYLLGTYQIDGHRIQLDMQVEPVLMTVDTAIPCALIINELVSNSLKYAFPDRAEGEIGIALTSTGEGCLRLVVGDNGVGLAPDLDLNSSKSLGLKLVRSLTEQLNGTLRRIGNKQGTTFEILFSRGKN
ncbi:MAG: histidine kinase dimerization/phosphoacceptor domain -containing protein [Acidobacteriota bacterium]